MTTYTAITTGEIDTDSPLTQTLMTKMRDNPLAQFEGATGAPRLQIAALANPAVGDLVKLERTSIQSSTSTSLATAFSCYVMQSGAVRIKFEQRTQSGGTCDVRVKINGSDVYAITAASSSFVARTTDQAISAGDLIQVQLRLTSTPLGSETAQIQLIQVCTSGAYVLPFLQNDIEVINP